MTCICEACGQQIKERPPRPLDLIDQLYLASGPCCAGCDFWEHDPGRTKPMGYCHKQPSGELLAFDMDFPGSISRSQTFATTEAKNHCERFQDSFDWTELGVENPSWLEKKC
jgi:hypothetical protein